MYMFVGCFKMIMCSKSSAQPNDYKKPRLIPTKKEEVATHAGSKLTNMHAHK